MQVPFLSLKDITAKYADELHQAVLRVTDSGWYLQGNENKVFEENYARYIGTKYCVGVANGLQALRTNGKFGIKNKLFVFSWQQKYSTRKNSERN